MDMGVAQAGQHQLAPQVHHLRLGAAMRLYLRPLPHGQEFAVANGHGRRFGPGGIDGVDIGVTDN